MELVEYQPFKDAEHFFLAYKDGLPCYLYFKDRPDNSFRLKIKPHGYVPRSGIFLCKSVTSLVSGKSILDIGTGETGIISIYCSKHRAKHVTGIDIDEDAVKWAEYNGLLNAIGNIEWLVSDKYENVIGEFDMIISNPPQMPMINGSLHDSGGGDGRETIEGIIEDSEKYLRNQGSLVLLLFDFLSVDQRYGSRVSIYEILKKKGFDTSIIAETTRAVRPEGKTYSSLSQIMKLFPRYRFVEDEQGRMYYRMLIVKGDLKK